MLRRLFGFGGAEERIPTAKVVAPPPPSYDAPPYDAPPNPPPPYYTPPPPYDEPPPPYVNPLPPRHHHSCRCHHCCCCDSDEGGDNDSDDNESNYDGIGPSGDLYDYPDDDEGDDNESNYDGIGPSGELYDYPDDEDEDGDEDDEFEEYNAVGPGNEMYDLSDEDADIEITNGALDPKQREQEEADQIAQAIGALENRSQTEVMPLLEQIFTHMDLFFNQTVGSLATWAAENLIWMMVVVASNELLHKFAPRGTLVVHASGEDVVLTDPTSLQATDTVREAPFTLLTWATWSAVVATSVCVVYVSFVAMQSVHTGIFSRLYMPGTQAYCGVIGITGSVFSLVATKAAVSPDWQAAFFGGVDGWILLLVCAVFGVLLNVHWFVSLGLTFVSTPYGRANVAFVQIPVAFAAAVIFILVNETGTRGAFMCSSPTYNVLAFLYANLSIATSLLVHTFSATEFDPAHVLGRAFHSTPRTPATIDIWAALHGAGVLVMLVLYAAVRHARFSQSTYIFLCVLIAFTLFVTAVHAIDSRGILQRVFEVADERAMHLQQTQETLFSSFIDARDAYVRERWALDEQRKHKERAARELEREQELEQARREARITVGLPVDDDMPAVGDTRQRRRQAMRRSERKVPFSGIDEDISPHRRSGSVDVYGAQRGSAAGARTGDGVVRATGRLFDRHRDEQGHRGFRNRHTHRYLDEYDEHRDKQHHRACKDVDAGARVRGADIGAGRGAAGKRGVHNAHPGGSKLGVGDDKVGATQRRKPDTPLEKLLRLPDRVKNRSGVHSNGRRHGKGHGHGVDTAAAAGAARPRDGGAPALDALMRIVPGPLAHPKQEPIRGFFARGSPDSLPESSCALAASAPARLPRRWSLDSMMSARQQHVDDAVDTPQLEEYAKRLSAHVTAINSRELAELPSAVALFPNIPVSLRRECR